MNTDSDRALLRRFEPIVRYTKGEPFFPMEIECYLKACSFWVQRPNEEPECLIHEGDVTIDKLIQPREDPFGSVYFLKFIEALNIAELTGYQLKQMQNRLLGKDTDDTFHPGRGRLARVGFLSRFAAALFMLSLLARGRVPGDTAAAATIAYRELMHDHPSYLYYGRVIRQNGWIALQYWFFYAFNNWRSGFFGMNDHEADWEMVTLYAYEDDDGEIKPEWAAYATHDFAGDDLRRRWDDPELEKEGDHPIIYAGAGSHASYFSRGEYLSEVEVPYLAPLVRIVDRLNALRIRFLRKYYGQYIHVAEEERAGFNIFRVPFVDYARGDGRSFGPGQEQEWGEPCVLNDSTLWATKYRGLWGLYANDPVAGENAPSGPMYNRDGSVRQSWYDPLGWSGLNKVMPPNKSLATLLEQQNEIKARKASMVAQITEKSRALAAIAIEAEAMERHPHFKSLYMDRSEKITALSSEIQRLRSNLAADETLLEAMEQHAIRLRAGYRGHPREHIHHAQRPFSQMRLRFSRLAEWWSSISIGLMIVYFVLLLIFAPKYLIFGLVALIALMIFAEAGFRERLTQMVSSLATSLAIVATLVLLYDFFWPVVVIAVLIIGFYIILENIRELSR